MKTSIHRTQRGIWETDVRSLDFENPRVLKWYVEKKIQSGDWEALDRQTLRDCLSQLDLNPVLRVLLERFLVTAR